MEESATFIKTLVEKAELYSKSSIDLLKLQAINKSANMLSSAVSIIIITIAFLSIITMVNIGVALWIGYAIDNFCFGFFIVASFYAFITIILSLFRTQLLKATLYNCFINLIRK